MQRGVSSYMFVGQRLTHDLLADIERARIPLVEIFCVRTHFDYRDPEAVRGLGSWFAGHSLKLHALHAPMSRDMAPGRESGTPMSISDLERLRRLDAVDEIKRALDVAESVPFRYLVQHISSGREGDGGPDPRRTEALFSSLEHLCVFAKQRGVAIALENTPGGMATPAYLRHFVQQTRLTDLRLCFDIGHAHMEDGVVSGLETMRDLVVTAHIHDNRGDRDEHLLPFEGTIDWPAAMKSLAGVPDSAGLPLILELKDTAFADRSSPAHMLEHAAAVLESLEKVPIAGA